MSSYQFSILMANTLGGMFGCLLVAVIVGGIYSAIKKKDSAGAKRAMFKIYWWYLVINYLLLNRTLTSSGNMVWAPDITLLISSVITSFIIIGIYKGIKVFIRKMKEKPLEKYLEKKSNEKQRETTNAIVERRPALSESDEYWGLISFAYGKIRQTNIFKLWRKEQFDCQFGKCAICGKPMDNKYSQVDHVKPRYKKGTNYSNNLALVHRKCNELKGAKEGFERPSWIKDNKFSGKLDDTVYEITNSIRKEYPTKFPDNLFEKPRKN